VPSFADGALRAAIGTRASAAVVRVEHRGAVVFERAYGTTLHEGGERVYVDTRFDLASLTKPIVTTVALALVARGDVSLDGSLLDLVPEWRNTDHAAITLRQILAHNAGFQSGADYRSILGERVEEFALTRPLAASAGERVIYSDLGFIALGTIVERAAGASLASVVRGVLAPLNVPSLSYLPSARERRFIPATENDAWRGLVQGSVHDEKAHLMGGVAGHAGIFGNARDAARIADWYLRNNGLAREALREQAFDPIARRGLGWVLKTSDENSCGAKMGPNTFGHTGFTGTCVWSDPDRDLTVVLLTNTVHYGRHDTRDLRAAICDAAVDFVEACALSV
jgi:CubicO group peptidase (beta-lactamase class C family)